MDILLVLWCFLAAAVAYVGYQRYFHPLASIPGPLLAALTSAWKLQLLRTGAYDRELVALHRKYGHFVRIAPNEVVISDKRAIKQIYDTVEGRDFHKTDFYDAFTAFRPTLFGQRDPSLHAQRKRIVGHGYSLHSLYAMEEFVQGCVDKFLKQMDAYGASGKPMDLAKYSHFFAFDTIGELAFSEGFGMLETGKEDPRIPLIGAQMALGTVLGMIPQLLLPISRHGAWVPVPWMRRQTAGRKKLKEMTESRVQSRQKNPSDRKDILGRLLEAKDTETGAYLDQIDVRTEAFSSIVAGSDSTSSGLAFTFYHVLANQDVFAKLTHELRSAFPDPIAADGSRIIPTLGQLNKITYLQAVIKESLRLTPPQTMNLPRYVPKGGKEIAGKYLPEGVRLYPTLNYSD